MLFFLVVSQKSSNLDGRIGVLLYSNLLQNYITNNLNLLI